MKCMPQSRVCVTVIHRNQVLDRKKKKELRLKSIVLDVTWADVSECKDRDCSWQSFARCG